MDQAGSAVDGAPFDIGDCHVTRGGNEFASSRRAALGDLATSVDVREPTVEVGFSSEGCGVTVSSDGTIVIELHDG